VQKGSALLQLALLTVLQLKLLAQIEKLPLLSLPYSQNRMKTVEPGVSPVAEMEDMKPFALPSSSQETKVSELHVPVYNAIPPSVMTPVLESKMMLPLAGTTALNQTSPPW
jgi:hypothetical protein